MAYDEELAARIRAILGDRANLTEQKMFGGLAFLIGGKMAVAASGHGGIMVRTDPTRSEQLISTGSAQPMEMRGRLMTGWLLIAADAVRADPELAQWVDRGVAYAASLPEQPAKSR
ncbi:MAG: TfoX/Sxy family protein [Candidatus Limnocylindria bacterium]